MKSTAPILIISHTHDIHGTQVLSRLEQRGADVLFLDTSRIPREVNVTLEHFADRDWKGTLAVDGRALQLDAIRSVWWRRPQPFTLHSEIDGADDRHFALSETHAAMSGAWSLLNARWMNDPDRDDRASRKAWQLRVAREAGLTVPRTCITNVPDTAREFVAVCSTNVIYKAFSATEKTWRETRVLKESEIGLLENVRFAPVIFQENIPGRADLRITVVGDAIFPAEIVVPQHAYKHDFRMSMESAAIVKHELPDGVATSIKALMKSLGLVYGAIDMRQTPGGDYVFLEINPAGQWLFIEHRTGQPISETIADQLAEWAKK